MHVLILTTVYPPEVRSSAQIMFQLAESIKNGGHTVTVITAVPPHRDDQTRRLMDRFFCKEDQDGVTVIRISTLPTHRTRTPALLRGTGQLLNAAAYFLAACFVPKPHVSLAYSPPLTLGIAGYLLKVTRHVPHVFNVQDLVPQYAIDLGILRSKLMIGIVKAIEHFVYKRVDAITVHSQGNKDYVVGEGVDSGKVHVIPNWVDTSVLTPSPKQNDFRARHNLNDKFVVLFAGVLGFAQDVDTIIDSAANLADKEDIVFLIVGEGVEKDRLVRKTAALNLVNVRFLPFVDKDAYPKVVAASDLCLATLQKTLLCPVVPSKILGYMAAGRPVVASFPLGGDAPAVIRNADCGICVDPGDPGQLSRAVLRVYESRAAATAWGNNGRQFVVEHHDREKCFQQYNHLFRVLA